MGGCTGACAPDLDGVQLRWGEAVVCLSRSWMRPEGGGSLRTGALLPVPSLLRALLREPEGERDVPGSSQGTIHTGASRGKRKHDGAIPGQTQRDALADLRAALVGAPRGRDGAACWHEGVAR